MVNFMCQLHCARGYSDLNNISGSVCEDVFRMRLALESVAAVKQVAFSNVGRHCPIPCSLEQNKSRTADDLC